MRFVAVAIDYDGTLANHGTVQPSTVAALEQLIASGRKFILVTGRILRELLSIFPQAELCSRIVAENGAVLYRPATREQRLLAEPASRPLVDALLKKGVTPLDIGESILATVRPHEVSVLEAIRDLGLEHHVVFNRESVMVLPPGINKASGLKSALDELQLSFHNVVGIGDSENDHALLQVCEFAVAVASAVPTLREAADWVTKESNGNGTAEALAAVVKDDFVIQSERLARHHIVLGTSQDGADIAMSPVGENLCIAGTSGSGKSTLAHGILERLTDRGYQVCVIDPEGDYESIDKTIVFGNARRGPTVSEILAALDNPEAQVVVNLVGIPLEDRPLFFLDILPRLQERQSQTGRPHRILIDETHHLMPQKWQPAHDVVRNMMGMLFVTVHPNKVSPFVLQAVDTVIALGDEPFRTLQSFADERAVSMPRSKPVELKSGEALLWRPKTNIPPAAFRMAFSRIERQRHRRKYAEGELPPERSFYFRGPDGKLNLRAQNLIVFCQLAEGVDDATWLHHLRQGDYSRWMEAAIKDPSLAQMIQQIEGMPILSAQESRQRIADAIEERYTLPSTGI
jgi:hydroxymethylpyrimidine pyrophosphatase-like HAD family hydrolase